MSQQEQTQQPQEPSLDEAKQTYNEVLNLDSDAPLTGGACNLDDGACEACQ